MALVALLCPLDARLILLWRRLCQRHYHPSTGREAITHDS
jgi:hypothetical protein